MWSSKTGAFSYDLFIEHFNIGERVEESKISATHIRTVEIQDTVKPGSCIYQERVDIDRKDTTIYKKLDE